MERWELQISLWMGLERRNSSTSILGNGVHQCYQHILNTSSLVPSSFRPFHHLIQPLNYYTRCWNFFSSDNSSHSAMRRCSEQHCCHFNYENNTHCRVTLNSRLIVLYGAGPSFIPSLTYSYISLSLCQSPIIRPLNKPKTAERTRKKHGEGGGK